MSIKTAVFRSVNDLDDKKEYSIEASSLTNLGVSVQNYAVQRDRTEYKASGKVFKEIYNDLSKDKDKQKARDLLRYIELVPLSGDKPKEQADYAGGGGSLPMPPALGLDSIKDAKVLAAKLTTFVSYFGSFTEEISEQLDHEGLMGKGSTFGGGSAYGAKFLAQAEKIGALAKKLPNAQIAFGVVDTFGKDKGSSSQFDFVKKILGALGIVVGDWFADFMASQEGKEVIEALQNRDADLKTLVSSSQEGSIYVNKIGLLLANVGGKSYYIGPMSASNIQNNLPAALGILQQMAQQNPQIQIVSQNPIVWKLQADQPPQTPPQPAQPNAGGTPPPAQPQMPQQLPAGGAAQGSIMLDTLIKVANILEYNQMYEEADKIDAIIKEAGLVNTIREQMFAPGTAIKKFSPDDVKTWGVAFPKWRDFFNQLKEYVLNLQQSNQKNPLMNQLVTLVSSLADNFNAYAEKQINVLQQLRRRKMKPTMIDRLTGQPQRAQVAR